VPKVTCRFYGRFLVAEPLLNNQPSASVSFLAPHMNTSPHDYRRFEPHHPLLAIPRAAVSRDQTTLVPSFRMMSDARASFAELLVWDLTGWTISIAGEPPFKLIREKGSRLVELDHPVPNFSFPPRLDPSGLAPTVDGLTRAAIHLNTGVGVAFASFKNSYNFVTESDGRDNKPINDVRLDVEGQLADVIEVAIEADDDKRVRLNVARPDGAGVISIDASAFSPTASITNLCPTLPRAFRYDLEFGRYYDYLLEGPLDAPIPARTPSGGDLGDCNEPAHLYYTP
jgi:hypothetical protein